MGHVKGGVYLKKIMAVYDEDPFYAERLSDYVNRKEKGVFQAQAFTSRECLEEYAKVNEIDVLLTGEATGFPEVDALRSAKTIYLAEDEVSAKGRSGGAGAEGRSGEKASTIYKYQSGDDIIREVMAAYCELPGVKEGNPGLFSEEKKMIGVYSPVGRCGKTSLALAIGQVLAREEKVLFVTLDTFTGFGGLMDEKWKRDMSDLIYYYKQGRFHTLRMNTVIYYLGDMAWIPPIRFPDDYNQVSAEEMADMLLKMLQEGGYSTMVLDIGNYGRQVIPLLDICSVIYMPMKEDIISRSKLAEFEDYAKESGDQKLIGKVQKIHVPLVTGVRHKEHFPQELLWGDLGDFVRGMLKGQRGLWGH